VPLVFAPTRRQRVHALLLGLTVGGLAALLGYLTVSFPLAAALKPRSLGENLYLWMVNVGAVWMPARDLFAAHPAILLERGWREILGLAGIALFLAYDVKLVLQRSDGRRLRGVSLSAQRRACPPWLLAGAVAAMLIGPFQVKIGRIFQPFSPLLGFFENRLMTHA
jgi:hypothetical protein